MKDFGKGTDLKAILLVGGDSLEEQFAAMTSNPDIIIATPGRFLHLKVEMYSGPVVHPLRRLRRGRPPLRDGFCRPAHTRSCTPCHQPADASVLGHAALVAGRVRQRAGLQEPSLVRLDAETKVSSDLQSAFFSIKGGEKEERPSAYFARCDQDADRACRPA